MSGHLPMPGPNREELYNLATLALSGEISDAEAERLEGIVLEDPQARRLYVEFMCDATNIRWLAANRHTAKTADGDEDYVMGWDLESNPQSPIPNPSFIPPIVIDPSPNLHSPVGSYLFSHVVAAVILGIGLLLGLAWRISLPVDGDSRHRSPGVAQAVAHITALADCKWTKQGSGVRGPGSGISEIQIPKSPNPQIPVFLGDRFWVASGLMQITYDTGAQVLLQGPCTYEIDSARGGYLAIGKLTAKVEKGSGIRGPGSGNANHDPLPTTHYPLFSVRTPTAIVTDLGTEFGVEVERSGATRSYVFQGQVELRENSRGLTTPGAPVEILRAGESARVERGRNNKVAILRGSGQPNRFARQIPKSPYGQISNSRLLTPLYRLIDLGTLGGPMSRANAINAAGQVVGEAATANGAIHAFLYDCGKMTDLGAPAGRHSGASAINATGQIVGTTSDIRGNTRAFLFSNGRMADIGALGDRDARAYGINIDGKIVGRAVNSDGVNRAFLYTPGKGMKDLGALGGVRAESIAMGINAGGMVVGRSETKNGPMHAFLYIPAEGMIDLEPRNGDPMVAFRVNDAGQVVGASVHDDIPRAFVYSRGSGVNYLGDLPQANNPLLDINNRGQILCSVKGMDAAGVSKHAFLYHDGKRIDLESLIDRAVGWTNLFAYAINDSGQIIGEGLAPDGTVRAFMLTPKRKP